MPSRRPILATIAPPVGAAELFITIILNQAHSPARRLLGAKFKLIESRQFSLEEGREPDAVAGVAEGGLGAASILMGGVRQDEGFFRSWYLIEGGKHASSGAGFINQAKADERWTFDARSKIDDVKISAGIVDGGGVFTVCIVEPLRPAAASADLRPEHIATGRNQGHGGGDFGVEAGNH